MVAIAFAFAVPQGFALTQAQAPDSGAPIVTDAGNKFCPISGDKVSDKGGTVEYEGKSYKLCCPMCAKDFLKDPKKAIEKMEAQEKAAKEGSEPVGMMGMEGHDTQEH